MTISRRDLIGKGSAVVGIGALLAACGGGDDSDEAERPRLPRELRADVTMLQTASSIEHVGLVAYDTALDAGLIETEAVGNLLQRFRRHHQQHAELFARATRDLGGSAFTEPNPAVLEQLKSSINALADEPSAVTLVVAFERIAAQTYQAAVTEFRDARLGVATMSIGGAEARHVAALVAVIGEVAVPAAFQTTELAVEPGTGL